MACRQPLRSCVNRRFQLEERRPRRRRGDDDVLKMAWLSAMGALLGHERNQLGALQRAAQAKAMGVSEPEKYGTLFPGSTITTTNNNGSWLKGALLGAAMLGTGAAGAAGLTGVFNKRAAEPPAVVSREGEEDVIEEEEQKDGSWKEVRRTRRKVGDKMVIIP